MSSIPVARTFSERVENFFYLPARPTPLAILRIGLAASLLIQAFMIGPDVGDFFGDAGILQEPIIHYFIGDSTLGLPKVNWISSIGGFSNVQIIFLVYIAALGALLAGRFTRGAALCTWLTHAMLLNTGYFFTYGANRFAQVALFYLIFAPSGNALSLDRFLGRARGEPSSSARFWLRVLQIHLCIAYVAAGVAKGLGPEWWNGEAIWRALMLPIFAQHDFAGLSHFPALAKIIGWGTLVIETGYPVFILPRRTRRLWVLLTVSMHVGIALTLGLVTFSMIMITLNLAAFGVTAEFAPAVKTTGRSIFVLPWIRLEKS